MRSLNLRSTGFLRQLRWFLSVQTRHKWHPFNHQDDGPAGVEQTEATRSHASNDKIKNLKTDHTGRRLCRFAERKYFGLFTIIVCVVLRSDLPEGQVRSMCQTGIRKSNKRRRQPRRLVCIFQRSLRVSFKQQSSLLWTVNTRVVSFDHSVNWKSGAQQKYTVLRTAIPCTNRSRLSSKRPELRCRADFLRRRLSQELAT